MKSMTFDFANPQDTSRAQAAFEALLPLIEAIPDSKVRLPWVNSSDLSTRAWNLAEAAAEPERMALFEQIPAQLFDRSQVATLHQAGWAMFHVERTLSTINATTSSYEPKIPNELAAEASALERRLQRLIDYNLGDDPTIAGQLAAIRAGVGHADLARDLHDLAALASQHEAVLQNDGNFWDPSLAARARELSAQILQEVRTSRGTDAQRWGQLRNRLFTLAAELYEDIRATALWLYRKDASARDRFPALSPLAPAPKSSAKNAAASAASTSSAPVASE